MKKRLTAIIICAGLLIGAAADAKGISVKNSGETVSLSLLREAGDETMLVVVRAGGSIDNNEDIYAMKLLKADENGIAATEFNMSDEKNSISSDGRYDVYVNENGLAVLAGSFAYAGTESRDEILKKFAEISSADALFDLFGAQENIIVLEAMGFDMDTYSKFSEADKKELAVLMMEYAKGFSNLEEKEILKAFDYAMAVKLINKSAQTEISEHLTAVNMEFENAEYISVTDKKLLEWLDGYIYDNKEYLSVSALEKAYETGNILYIINNTRFNDMEGQLSKYADVLEIENASGYGAYKALGNKTAANEKIASALKSVPAKTPAELDAVIKKASETDTNKNQSSGGGGNGGGASKGGITSSVPSAKDNEIKNETEKTQPFNDLEEAAWAGDAINKMAEANIVAGDGSGKFHPNDIMTREEFVKMLVLAADMYDENAECLFSDVNKDAWYFSYIASAYNKGLVYGINENEFGVGNFLTRQDMMVIAARAAEKIKTLSQIRIDNKFADDELISDYAKEAVSKLYMAGIANGTDENRFDPLGNATRAQGALIIYNLFLK